MGYATYCCITELVSNEFCKKIRPQRQRRKGTPHNDLRPSNLYAGFFMWVFFTCFFGSENQQARGKGPGQKPSKIVKANFDNFRAGQKIVKNHQIVTSQHFSTILVRHQFSGLSWGALTIINRWSAHGLHLFGLGLRPCPAVRERGFGLWPEITGKHATTWPKSIACLVLIVLWLFHAKPGLPE